MNTKHRSIRLSDDDWRKLAATFRAIVPDAERPPNANPETDWQVMTGLRLIAQGDIALTVKVD